MTSTANDRGESEHADARTALDAQWYRALFEMTPDAVYRFDLQGRFTAANAACEEVCGYAREELIGSSFEPLVIPEHRRRVLRLFAAARAGRPQYFELAITHRSGRRVELRGAKIPVLVDGQVVAVAGVSRDVTAEVEAREARRAAERHYRALFEQSPIGVLLFDATLRVTDCNEALLRLMRLPRDRVVGAPLREVPDARPLDALRDALRGVDGWYVGPFVTPADQALLSIAMRAAPLRNDQGTVTGGIVLIEDLTERDRAVSVARERDRTLETLVEAAPVAIVLLDREQRVSAWNPAAERLFGWSRHEVLGRPLPYVAPESREQVDALLERERAGHGHPGLEVERVRKDGSTVWVSLSTAALRDADGGYAGSIGILADATLRRRATQAQLQSQRLEAVGQLAGGVAHDFNNLLTAIVASCDLASIDPTPAAVDAELTVIREAALRGAALTRQLLAFTRQQVLHPTRERTNDVVASVQRLLERLIGEHIRIETALSPLDPLVTVDRAQLEQVLVNLALNARDAMPTGGVLSIATATATVDASDASRLAIDRGRYTTIAVADTGVGMDAATRARAFEPFFTTKQPGAGTGLGLAMVHGTVRQSGGAIDVRSEVGHGALFTIYLPLVVDADPIPSKPVTAPSRTTAIATSTVLVVEDERSVRLAVERLLTSRGYRVLAAADPVEALRIFERHAPDVAVVVTDVVMPYMLGPQLVERLRAARPDLPVIFLSGYAPGDVLADAPPSGAPTVFLAKPFAFDALLDELERVRMG